MADKKRDITDAEVSRDSEGKAEGFDPIDRSSLHQTSESPRDPSLRPWSEPSVVTDPMINRITREETLETRVEFLDEHRAQLKKITATLTMLNGPEKGKVFEVSGRRQIILGRSKDCDIQIKDLSISRKHLTVNWDESGSVTVTDLNSSNGSFVNDQRVEQRDLQDNDRIRIGENIILKFSLSDDIDKAYAENLYESANKDFLTKAFKKDSFVKQFTLELESSQKSQSPMALIMFDIDHFKKINDTYGHTAGDYVLAEIVKLFLTRLRQGNIIGRYGGEEFILYLKDTNLNGAVTYGEKMLETVRSHPFVYENAEIKVRISMGIALSDGLNTVTVEELIRVADQRLYQAKEGGRDQLVAPLSSELAEEKTRH